MKEQEEIDHDDLVFPRQTGFGVSNETIGGLTKREWFAAMALQGLLATWTDTKDARNEWDLVRQAWKFSDVMLVEGKKS